MGKYWVILLTGWMALAAAGENGAGNPGAAQAQPGDADKQLKKATRTEEKLSVRELLERYAANQKQAFTSFIHKSETREDMDMHCTEQHGGISPRIVKRTQYYGVEFRTDNQRIKKICCKWGQRNNGEVRSKDNRGYTSWLWDGGKSTYQYGLSTDISDPGRLYIDPSGPPTYYVSKNYIKYGHVSRDAWGYLVGDEERWDEVLLKATNISVRNRKEKIRRVSNYVIDAATERGTYTVWIDPEHGYNFSKVLAHRRPGDKIFEAVHKEIVHPGEEYLTVVEVTKFQEIDGVWIPSETTMKDHRKYANGDYIDTTESFTVLSMEINPDHDALGSFLIDYIRDGARTTIVGIKGIDYTWQDGKVVDKAGKVLDLHSSKPADPNQAEAGEKNAENTGTANVQPGDADKQLKKATRTEDQLSARELLERYAATQTKAFTSFIHKSQTREDLDIYCTEQHGGIPPRIVKYTKFYEFDFRTDGLRIQRKFSVWG